MYAILDWTFTPGPAGEGTILVPGAFTPQEFAQIINLDQENQVIFDSQTEATMSVEPAGLDTLLTLNQTTSASDSGDRLQILMYSKYSSGGTGPSTDVAVTNWPASQNVTGTVDVGNFPATQTVDGTVGVTGTVDVGNFPTTQTVDGTVDVGNFPATQTVDGSVSVSNFPASTTVDGTVDVGNFPTTQTVDGTVDVGNFPTTQTVDGSVTINNDSGNPVPVTFPSGVSVSNFPATQTVDGTVDVGNFPTSFDVGNFPATQTVDGSVTVSGTVDVGNFPASTTVAGTVDVGNFPATQTVDGSVTVSGTVDVGNFPTTQAVTGTFFQTTQPVSGTIDVGNFPASTTVDGTVDVGNFPATQTVDGTVTANQGTSPWIVSSTGGSTNIAAFPSTSTDAFGRLRVSEPFTLFDSSFRYGDTALWSTETAAGGTAVYNAPQGLMDLNVTTTSGSSVQRQTRKVFAYQPGKSLLVMTTFVCASPKANLDQKIGYYGSDNGYFLEQDGLTTYFVERSAVSGAVTNTRVAQSAWNVDKMDGTGPSGITLDISKAQILWMDLEWLGVGTVKMGFVVNGQFYICHAWDHANLITSTYITTASLPLSCEITNTGATASASTFKQICATVISEGGYALTGLQQSVGTPVTTAKTLTTAGTFYPIVSIRLKTTRLDAIAILTAISIQGTGNNNVFRWEVRAAGTSTAGAWVSAGADSSVEYNLTGTGYTNGRILAAGFTSSSNQGTPSINILKEALFTFQLERDAFTATPYEITITVAGATNGTSCYASMDWEEVSR